MDIVFLDQNKWIDLSRVYSGNGGNDELAALLPQLIAAVQKNRVLFPLTVANILETAKRNDPVSRRHVAETQALLSKGSAFRSRKGRLDVELRRAIERSFGLGHVELPTRWAIAPSFMQAFEWLDELVADPDSVTLLQRMESLAPPSALYVDYMCNQDEALRRHANKELAEAASGLINRIEARRALFGKGSTDLRRRTYAAQLWVEQLDLLNRALKLLGFSFEQMMALGHDAPLRLLEGVPTMAVEAEMVARLESKTGPLSANDLFDIQSFSSVIPYVNRIVAEKASISRAQQARLDEKYGVVLSRDLSDLLDVYRD